MMKKWISFVLCLFVALVSFAQLPELTVEQNLEDYDFAVKYIEDNYSGFLDKVVDSNRADYESMKSHLRSQVEQGERPGWDAVGEYTAWFNDTHLSVHIYFKDDEGNRIGLTEKYNLKKKRIHYESQMEYAPKPVACKVTDKTFLIRFPSCGGDPDMKWIKKSVKLFKKSHCRNLILDIRGNGGGDDRNWYPYLALVCDHNAWESTSEYRNTPQNISYVQKTGWPIAGVLKKESVKYPEAQYLRGGLFQRLYVHRPDKRVQKAAVIVDNGVASAGEGMVLSFRAYSNRVNVFGRDNTLGCLDYANVATIEMEHCGRTFQMPMSRKFGLPDGAIDATGIAPDVRIPLPLPARLTDNIDEWVIWVAEQLEK
jgi:hypothetical protein